MVKIFETFGEVTEHSIDNMKHNHPSCFNGNVRVKKFRITIAEVNEEKEVIEERLQKLWDACNNWHHWTPLESEAKKIGYKLKGEAGNKGVR